MRILDNTFIYYCRFFKHRNLYTIVFYRHLSIQFFNHKCHFKVGHIWKVLCCKFIIVTSRVVLRLVWVEILAINVFELFFFASLKDEMLMDASAVLAVEEGERFGATTNILIRTQFALRFIQNRLYWVQIYSDFVHIDGWFVFEILFFSGDLAAFFLGDDRLFPLTTRTCHFSHRRLLCHNRSHYLLFFLNFLYFFTITHNVWHIEESAL